MSQQVAILRYLGAKYGYYPKDAEEAYWSDWAIDTNNDCIKENLIKPLYISGDYDEKARKDYIQNIKNFAKLIDGVLLKRKTEFIAGANVSIGDFVMFSSLYSVCYNKHDKHQDLFDEAQGAIENYETFQKWRKAMEVELKDHMEARQARPY